VKVRQLALFAPLHHQVQIAQKVVIYTPTEKLLAGYIAMLAGAHDLVGEPVQHRDQLQPSLQPSRCT
jgi:hypothetical protein